MSETSFTTTNMRDSGCFGLNRLLCPVSVRKIPESMEHVVKRENSHAMPAIMLTAQQKRLLQRTWMQLSVEVSLLGVDCMTTLWKQCPEVAPIFQLPSEYSRELHRNTQFHQHACWLVQTISAAVENINNHDRNLADTLIEIGVKHAAVPQFPAETFAALPKAWATVWTEHLSGRYAGQTEKSWAKVFVFISDCLTEGYQQCTFFDDLEKKPSKVRTNVSWVTQAAPGNASLLEVPPETPKIGISASADESTETSARDSSVDPLSLNHTDNPDQPSSGSSNKERRLSRVQQRRLTRSEKINMMERAEESEPSSPSTPLSLRVFRKTSKVSDAPT